jgi:photosystem II stability/assembly factor-like uncharacterized protein
MAVGSGGLALRTEDGGKTWVRLPAISKDGLTGVRYLDARRAIAVGDSGAAFLSVDGGATWSLTPGRLSKGKLVAVASGADGAATVIQAGGVFRIAGVPPAAIARQVRRAARRAPGFFMGAPIGEAEGLRRVDPIGRGTAGFVSPFAWPYGKVWFGWPAHPSGN